MPVITPEEWGRGLIVRHAVSQGYIKHVSLISSGPPVYGHVWVDLDEMSITVPIDEPSTVLQIFRCTASISAWNYGRQVYFRLRHGNQYTVQQTHEADIGSGIVSTDNASITLFRAWPNVPVGNQTFGLQLMFLDWAGEQWPVRLSDLRMVLAILKR